MMGLTCRGITIQIQNNEILLANVVNKSKRNISKKKKESKR